MRILICSTLFPGMAGIPKYAAGISKEFLKLGHSVAILCEREENKKQFEKIGKIDVFRHNITEDIKRNLELIEERARNIKGDFDLIIVLWYKYFRPIKNVFPSAKKVYIVPSVRKIDITVLNKHHPFLKRHYYHFINRFSINLEKEAVFKSDKVIALGNQMNGQLKKSYGFYDAQIVNPGVDRTIFKFKKRKKENIFLIVANLDPRKGIDRAINVANFLKNGKIKVLGGGKRMDLYQNKINNLNVNDRIILNGPTKDVWNEMIKSKALLMTSYSEGFPLIFPEALSSGLPIIAFQPDGKNVMNASDEVVVSGKNGFLVKTEKEMARKIDLLAKDSSLQRRMSENSLISSQKFSWKNVAEKIIKMSF